MNGHGVTFALVRHGQSAGNTRGLFTGGRSDTKLSELGKEQARATGAYLRGCAGDVAAVYSSPLARALNTAEIIAVQLGSVVQTVADLVEFDFGELEGKSTHEVHRAHPGILKLWNPAVATPIPGGESAASVASRMCMAFQRIADGHLPGESVIVVGHAGALAMSLAMLLGDEKRALEYMPSNCGVTWIEMGPPPRLVEFNHTAHLEEAGLGLADGGQTG